MPNDRTPTHTTTYLYEYGETEEQRLIAQGKVLDPLTRRLLVSAGITPGMRVLDLGSGVGNVSTLAAELVGPDGAVVGIDKDPEAVARARRRAQRTGDTNIEYLEGDVHTLEGVQGHFDAVIGRVVLAYLADPTAALRAAAARLRPGGVICMQEGDMAYDWSCPETPLWQQVRSWFLEAMTRASCDPRMAHSLFPAFRAAGLPDPELKLEAVAGGGAMAPAFGWANAVIGVVPLMERMGIATREQVHPDTLLDRLLAESDSQNGTVVGPLLFGAWARTAEER